MMAPELGVNASTQLSIQSCARRSHGLEVVKSQLMTALVRTMRVGEQKQNKSTIKHTNFDNMILRIVTIL